MTRKISRLQINAAEANANQILRVDVSDNLVFSNVATLLTAGQNIIIHANGMIDAANVITSEQVSVTNLVVTTDLTTSNVAEGLNLYFTNTRARDALVGSNVFVGNVIAQGGFFGNTLVIRNINVQDSALTASIDTTNLNANTFVANSVTSNTWLNLYTANVTESASNLYYTNARVRSALSGGTGVSYDDTTGVINIGQNVFPNTSVVFGNVTITGNLNVIGNSAVFETNSIIISDPLIQVGKGNDSSDILDLGFFGHYYGGDPATMRHAGLFRDTTDKQFKLFANLTAEPGTEIDTANASYENANLVVNYIVGKVTDISNHSTTNLAEGTNLYYTNARVISAVDDFITTSNVDEGINLYYTNARVNAFIQPFLTTANVVESTSNLYFTDSRAILATIPAVTQLIVTTPIFNYNLDQYSGDNPNIYVFAGETLSFDLNQSASHPLAIRVSNGGSNYDTGLTHVDDNGTISTGSSAQGKYTGKLFWKIPYELAGNTYVYQCTVHSSMVGNIVIQKSPILFTTTDIVEGINLYYTNVRVDAQVDPKLTTANVIELTNQYFTNTRARDALVDSNIFVGNVIAQGGFFGNTLVIRNINVQDGALSASIDTTNLNSNTLTANAISSNLWLNLYTANVIESSSNLYFTNARVLAGLAVSNLTTTNLILSGSIFDTGNLDLIAGSGGLDGNIILNAGGGPGIVFSRGSNISAGNLNITGDITDTGNLRIVAGTAGSGNIELNPISGIVNANPANVHVGNVIATGGFVGQSLVIRNINVGDAALQDVAVGGSTANTTVSNTYTQLFGTAQVRIGSAHTIGWNMVWGI